MKRTSPSSRLVRIAARSPARSSAGPLVIRHATSISVATIPARVVLPRPGRPGEQHVVDGLAALAGRPQHDLEVLLEPGLTDELGQPPRPQRGLLRRLDRVGLGAQQLVAGHHSPTVDRTLTVTPRGA